MENYLDNFKQYVPAEIIAAFIAINSLIPHKEPMDVYLIVVVIFLLSFMFIVSSIKFKRFKSLGLLLATAATLPFWCFSIAISRFDNLFDTADVKVVISVALILISVGLTLFGGRGLKKDGDNV